MQDNPIAGGLETWPKLSFFVRTEKVFPLEKRMEKPTTKEEESRSIPIGFED